MLKASVYIALVHHPVVNKHGEIVTTSLTNFDLHDLGRTSKTFGVKKFFIVTPIEPQQKMALYVKKYWREGLGAEVNPDRREAFQNLEVAKDIAETCLTIKNLHGIPPTLVATSARSTKKTISFKELRGILNSSSFPFLVLFGTGWGLASSVLEEVDHLLEPIKGVGEYNHLPVRSAVAIILDRILGRES